MPIAVEEELEEVGEDQIGEGLAIALELVGRLNVIEIFLGRVLGLDVTDDPVLTIPHAKIRVAGFGLFGEGSYVNFASAGRCGNPLKESLQARVETLLPGVPLASHVGDTFEIFG